jgi:hypothetical protein
MRAGTGACPYKDDLTTASYLIMLFIFINRRLHVAKSPYGEWFLCKKLLLG